MWYGNGRDDVGREVSSGMYLYWLDVDGEDEAFLSARRMVLFR